MIHSLPLRMSVVQVFVGAQMAVVAHLVDADTIGRLTKLQLEDEVIFIITSNGYSDKDNFLKRWKQ